MTLTSDLENQRIGMCVSISCRNIRTEHVLPDAEEDAEQVPPILQS